MRGSDCNNMNSIRNEVEKAVREAGKIIIETDMNEILIEKKGTKNFVTQVDLAVEKALSKSLKEIIPECSFLREESEGDTLNLNKPTWIIDPVDGTTNFMRDYKWSAVSVALFVEGKPFIGVIYNPYFDETFSAQAGEGAYLNNKQIKVTTRSRFEECLIAFGTNPYDRTQAHRTFSIAEKVFVDCLEIRRGGAASIDLAYVACGRLDGFFEMELQPWDYAAGLLIIQEAGGKITNWENKALDYLKSSSIIATNGLIHEHILNYIRKYSL